MTVKVEFKVEGTPSKLTKELKEAAAAEQAKADKLRASGWVKRGDSLTPRSGFVKRDAFVKR